MADSTLDPAKCEHPSPKVRVGKRAYWHTEECECGAWRQLLYGKNPWNPPNSWIEHMQAAEQRNMTSSERITIILLFGILLQPIAWIIGFYAHDIFSWFH